MASLVKQPNIYAVIDGDATDYGGVGTVCRSGCHSQYSGKNLPGSAIFEHRESVGQAVVRENDGCDDTHISLREYLLESAKVFRAQALDYGGTPYGNNSRGECRNV